MEEKQNTKEEKKLRKSKEVVYKNKVQKECPKEKKIENWKKEVVRKRKRKGEKGRKKIQKEVCCRKIKGWRE